MLLWGRHTASLFICQSIFHLGAGEGADSFTFTFMHFADAFIQSDLHCIQVTVSTFYQLLLSLGIEPMILALLAPCSTSWATGKLLERFLAKSALREGHTSLSPVPTESINVPMYTYTIHHKHSVQCLSLLKAHTNKGRRRLAIGSTGTFPGGLAADLARCPEYFFFAFPVPRWSFPIVVFPNKLKINHKSVSLDWQRRASCLFLAFVKQFWTESMHGTRGRRGNGQKKQWNVTKLLTCAGHY